MATESILGTALFFMLLLMIIPIAIVLVRYVSERRATRRANRAVVYRTEPVEEFQQEGPHGGQENGTDDSIRPTRRSA